MKRVSDSGLDALWAAQSIRPPQEGQCHPYLYFAHANGYPPAVYRGLLRPLARRYHVTALALRPLWEGTSPDTLKHWGLFAEDVTRFLIAMQVDAWHGIGHSVGATISLMAALGSPHRFRSLALIEPVIFPPPIWMIWRAVFRLGLAAWIHPLARRSRRRKRWFTDKQAMFDNYREKSVFRRLPDGRLWDYVEGISQPSPTGTGVTIRYPPEWETRIYETGLLKDGAIWDRLGELEIPVLIIRGEHSATLWQSTFRRLAKSIPSVHTETISGAGHLAPLEDPEAVGAAIDRFLTSLDVD